MTMKIDYILTTKLNLNGFWHTGLVTTRWLKEPNRLVVWDVRNNIEKPNV